MNAYVGGGDETADTDTVPKFHLASAGEGVNNHGHNSDLTSLCFVLLSYGGHLTPLARVFYIEYVHSYKYSAARLQCP